MNPTSPTRIIYSVLCTALADHLWFERPANLSKPETTELCRGPGINLLLAARSWPQFENCPEQRNEAATKTAESWPKLFGQPLHRPSRLENHLAETMPSSG